MAGVDVGFACRDDAKFQRRSGRDQFRNRIQRKKFFREFVAMAAAGDGDHAFGRCSARSDLDGRRIALLLAGQRPRSPKQTSDRRRVNDAGGWMSMFDERDIDGELAVATEELFGAVERIDEEEHAGRDVGIVSGGATFLRDDGNAGRDDVQPRDDVSFRVFVGDGDGRLVGLLAVLDFTSVVAHDQCTGVARDFDHARE